MAALLNTIYADPRAQKLYGGGNAEFSDADIKAFITQPGMTADKIYKKALETGVSAKQITNAMYGTEGYDPRSVDDYISKQGVSLGHVKPTSTPAPGITTKPPVLAPAPSKVEVPKAKTEYADSPNVATYTPAATPNPVRPSSVKLTPADTVSGQLDAITRDPNSPLLRQAQTRGLQSANRRGLSNSSIAVSAGESSLLDAATPIAAQDANTNFASKSQNSQLAQSANLFNADTLAKMNMFNSDLGSKTSMFNADLGSKVGMFNADLGTKTNLFNADLGSRVGMFNADTESKTNMFNSDLGSRIDMFNAGASKDVMMQRESNDLNRYIADMDAGNKLAIANIQAMANDTGIMGDLGKSLMSLYQQTAADPNISPEVKSQIFSNLKSQYENITSLLPTFEKIGKKLIFGVPSDAVTAGNGGTGVATDQAKELGTTNARNDGAVATPGKDGKVGSIGSVVPNQSRSGYTIYMPSGSNNNSPVAIDTSNFKLSTQEVIGINRFNSINGFERISLDDVVPQSFVDEIARQNAQGMYGYSINTFAAPIQPPGTMRADMPAYYVWKAAVPKYQ